MEMFKNEAHVVGIIGGAVAGSEAAKLLASKGVVVIVFEQNSRPYGKIEDGLPRWHEALRKQEYAEIQKNLNQPGVYFVPKTRLGRDVTLEQLISEWKLSAVVLAHGAWRDRPLGIEGIDRFVGKGLAYQNSFVYWFNHSHETGYTEPRYNAVDNAIVVGGGLASIDVVKILNLEVYGRALAARGTPVSMHDMERGGIGATLQKLGVTPEELGVKGCTLYYRRRKKDMPLASAPANATPEQLKKTETVREKVMDVCIKKYLVRFEECHMPVAPVVEGDKMAGLVFRRTEVKDGKLVEVPGSDYEVRSELTVSSIGSIPEQLPGIAMKGELYSWANWDTGALSGYGGVFGLGNVLTGKGNIKSSRENASDISEHLLKAYLGLDGEDPKTLSNAIHADAAARAEPIAQKLESKPKLSPGEINAILGRVAKRWGEVGYNGDFGHWMAQFAHVQ